MYKILAKSIREYKKQSIQAPVLVSMEVLLECIIPFIIAKLVNEIKAGCEISTIIWYGAALIAMAALAPVRLGLVREGQCVLDIGTGAGFPGVPLAIAGLSMTMLDASEKKIGFVRESCEALAIPAVCIWGRAEELAAHIGKGGPIGPQDAVVARAVARLAVLLELGSAFVKKGGLFLAYKGEAAQEEADEAQNAAKVLGLRLREIVPAGLPGRAHSLVVYEKVADTPKGYPRKFAKIKARPL